MAALNWYDPEGSLLYKLYAFYMSGGEPMHWVLVTTGACAAVIMLFVWKRSPRLRLAVMISPVLPGAVGVLASCFQVFRIFVPWGILETPDSWIHYVVYSAEMALHPAAFGALSSLLLVVLIAGLGALFPRHFGVS